MTRWRRWRHRKESGKWRRECSEKETADTHGSFRAQAVALSGAVDKTADVESQPEKNTPDKKENAAPSATAFVNRKGRWQASFAASADSESAITIKDGDHTVSWHLEQAAPSEACRKDAQVLVYPEILPGIDAEYHTAGQAVKENLILKGAAQVPEDFTFVYHAEGLQAVQKGNRVLFTDETETEVFCMSAPLMKDASGAKSEQLKVALEEDTEEKDTWRITLMPDHSWLRDAARVYPVTVDPLTTSSLEVNEIEDAHVDNLNFGTELPQKHAAENNGRGQHPAQLFKVQASDAEDRGYGDGCIPFAGIPPGPEKNAYCRGTPCKTAMVFCNTGLEQPPGIRSS